MKYILLAFLFLLITGCNNKKTSQNKIIETNNTKEANISKITKINPEILIINEKEFNLTFKKNRLIYPKEKTILLFYTNDFYSKEEERILNKLHVKYYKTDNEFLKKYFNINYYPTIVVLDNNKTVKFENFTPYEILKTEGF